MGKSFADFKLNKQLLTAIEEAGYTTPTPIQVKAIPPVLAGQDLLGIAQTGTGKTAAFVLPMLMKVKYAQGMDPRVLILAPTRELAIQVQEHVLQLSQYTDLRTLVLYGGLGPKTQIERLKQGVDILVATPGRFLDLYLQGHIGVKSLKMLILDEADKMMDMGFIGKIHRILEVVPRKRQNLLFSATMSALVEKISGDFLAFPTKVEVSVQATPAQTVTQHVYEVPNEATKINVLKYLFQDQETFSRMIVFCRTRVTADAIFALLERRYKTEGVRVIHANKGQNTRINSINAFKSGEVRILVATDVAARGLDIEDISHVINFDVPIVIEDYVHRIGRTGRANKKGAAITFCTPSERYYLKKIEKLIRQSIPVQAIPGEVPVPDTPFKEKQEMAREIDRQKRKENPDFKGAFHEKKIKKEYSSKKGTARKKRGSARR